MSNIHRKAFYAIAAIALSLGANGIALADPVDVVDSNPAVASSDSQCNGESPLCAGPSQATHDQAQPRHTVSALHKARLHSVRKQGPAAPLPVVVANNWGFAPWQLALSCKGENAWSLLCPGSQVLGIYY
jgi:hypothetical protein